MRELSPRHDGDVAAFTVRRFEDLSLIDAREWNVLLAADGGGNVLLRHEFLHALTASGCATPDTGWAPRFVTLWSNTDARLVAAAPLYDKFHSYGEYVFDWAWADAYERNSLQYYPKRLVAVPFSPVPGARLIAVNTTARHALARALVDDAADAPSLHVLYPPARDAEALAAAGCFERANVQFHWCNRPTEPYSSFDDFLAALAQPKRKKIRAERRKVADAGVSLQRKTGREITDADWVFFNRCYRQTYAEHRSTPYLNLDFFRRLGDTLGEHVLMVVASHEGRPIAASLGLFDPPTAEHAGRLYGRHWGALEHVPCLHFECCYYQMIEFAIERGLVAFEGGAQGAHKMARGLDPVTTRSMHWIADPRLRRAIELHVTRERSATLDGIDELNEHRAYRERDAVPGD